MPLTRDCFTQIVTLLAPYMQDEGMRQVILQPALYGTPLLNQIVFSGNSQTFTVMLIRKLDEFGRVTKDKTAVTAILEALQGHVGWDKQEEIISLINCTEGRSTPAAPTVDDVPDLPPPTNIEARDHLFISYSSVDRVSFVDRLAGDLSSAGHTVWVDNLDAKYGGIIAGKPWQQELANALNRAKLVIFVITPDSIHSKWVQAELKRAGDTNRTVIGIVVRPLKGGDRDMLSQIQVGNSSFNDLHYRDFTTLGYERGIDTLQADIERQS